MKRSYNIRVRDDMRGVLKGIADLLNTHPDCADSLITFASGLEAELMRKRLRSAGASK